MYLYANQKQQATARYQQETDDFIRSMGFQALPRALGIMALGMTTSRSPFLGGYSTWQNWAYPSSYLSLFCLTVIRYLV
jgi:hypothetical protein